MATSTEAHLAGALDIDLLTFDDIHQLQTPIDTSWLDDQYGEQRQATMTWAQDEVYQEHQDLQSGFSTYPVLDQHDPLSVGQYELLQQSAYEQIYDQNPEDYTNSIDNPNYEPASQLGYYQFGALTIPASSWPETSSAPYYLEQPRQTAPLPHALASASITVDFNHDCQAMPLDQATLQLNHQNRPGQTPMTAAPQPKSQYPTELLVLVDHIHKLRRTARNLPYRSDLKDGKVPIIRQHFCSRKGILKGSSILRDYYGDENLFDMTFWEFLDNVKER